MTELENRLKEALKKIDIETSLESLEKIRLEWMSKKGIFPKQMRNLSNLSETERPAFGKQINIMKQSMLSKLDRKKKEIEELNLLSSLENEYFDVTMPGRKPFLGSRHPVSLARERIEDFFTKYGFLIETGPQIENDFYNFEALNIGKDHPARAMQDTFYIDEHLVLRTHTSNVQIRTMKGNAPPLRVIAPGRVYRSDSDATHTPMFHQVEGMFVDKNVSFSDLKSILITFLRDFFENNRLKVRFRPSYFPFTEPSAEVDITCFCKYRRNKKGNCKVCGDTGWLEVLGCGMMHPNVLKNGNIDPDIYQGYAFGIGIERLAMLRYQANDLRKFFENDIRFLAPFKGE